MVSDLIPLLHEKGFVETIYCSKALRGAMLDIDLEHTLCNVFKYYKWGHCGWQWIRPFISRLCHGDYQGLCNSGWIRPLPTELSDAYGKLLAERAMSLDQQQDGTSEDVVGSMRSR